jgi:hypothetical protein
MRVGVLLIFLAVVLTLPFCSRREPIEEEFSVEGTAPQASPDQQRAPERQSTSSADTQEELTARANDNLESEAEKVFIKTREEAERLTREGKVREALETLNNYPVKFSGTKWQKEIEELAKPLQSLAEAESRFTRMKSAADQAQSEGDIDRAFELVKEFPENLRVGEWRSKWEALFEDISAKKKEKDEQADKERAIPWETLFDGTNLDRWTVGQPTWELKDATMVGKHSGERFAETYAVPKEGTWDNFILELEFKIVSGEYLVVGIRGKPDEGRETYKQVDLPAKIYKPGTWFKVRIEARGNSVAVIDVATNSRRMEKEEPEYTEGPISLFISGDSEVHLKSIRIKRLK